MLVGEEEQGGIEVRPERAEVAGEEGPGVGLGVRDDAEAEAGVVEAIDQLERSGREADRVNGLFGGEGEGVGIAEAGEEFAPQFADVDFRERIRGCGVLALDQGAEVGVKGAVRWEIEAEAVNHGPQGRFGLGDALAEEEGFVDVEEDDAQAGRKVHARSGWKRAGSRKESSTRWRSSAATGEVSV